MKYIANILLIFFLLSATSCLVAQDDNWVDTVMATYPSDFKNIEGLVERIDYDFKLPKDKVRALYLWLASNIKYDEYHEATKPVSEWILFTSEYDKERKKKALFRARLDDYFTQKKALCRGYSSLFELGCELMGIKARSVNGYSKVRVNDIAKSVWYKNHAWNAVWLNAKWNFIDITWSAGYVDTSSGRWIPYFNDYYYEVPAEIFIRSHYPVDPFWQLLQRPISEVQFFAEPIYYPAYFEQNYSLEQSQNGKIMITGNTIRLEFNSLPENTPLYYSFDGQTSILPVKRILKNKANNYEVVIPARKGKYKQLTLYTEFMPILDFKIAAH